MIELKTILKDHAEKYPLMMPCDAVKLIYQNEFGGGHLIFDSVQSLNYLMAEYQTVVQLKDKPLYEHIGNGIIRVNIAALDSNNLSIQKLNELFVQSSAIVKGSINAFMVKLNILAEIVKMGVFSFNEQVLDSYLKEYVEKGCPAVSHSKEYKQAYKPAYRVVIEDLKGLELDNP